ncbi:sodium:proton antiporter [marine bacterium AO1-C]|nr:sodium:proton antiporter [marine bacterium AO1-C]
MEANLFNAFTVLIVLTALFSILNKKVIKLPSTIGVMLIALVVSLVMIVLSKIYPATVQPVCKAVEELDFPELLMEVMLSFLIFAGAFHTNTRLLTREGRAVLIFATLGVLISTFVVGGLTYLILPFIGLKISFVHCLLFGALISPTDPIAVLAILKASHVPKSLETDIAGESLLNDGVAVVVFITILNIAEKGIGQVAPTDVMILFVKEAIGGGIWGFVLGWIGFQLMKIAQDDKIDVLITLAMVMGGYLSSEMMHISGPLAVVMAGLVMSAKVQNNALGQEVTKHVNIFWENVDEVLNAVLFLLIGAEIINVFREVNSSYIIAGILAIAIVLIARAVSVALPLPLTSLRKHSPSKSMAILIWGGLRGGISVALALSLKDAMSKDLIVTMTYIVVVFSIIVQGLTIGKLVQRLKL